VASDLWNSIPESWQASLIQCRNQIDEIDALISTEKAAGLEIVPSVDRIFAALVVPPSEVSVVVIGQDPYPTAAHALGMAFAVPSGTKPLPGSLRNIFKEIDSDLGRNSVTDCSLTGWIDQGVLLLNTTLTTQAGVRAAHASWPWDQIVRAILEQVVAVNPKVVGMLWGNHAKQFADLFQSDCIAESAHPSPLSASRGFLGSKPFTRANQILAVNGKSVISW
jgi:uracil-DNA glycosylase